MSLPYTPALVTLDYVRRDRRLKDVYQEHKDDFLMAEEIAECSAQFQESILPSGRVFVPYRMVRAQDYQGTTLLKLDEDLLEVVTITNGDATPVSTSGLLYAPTNAYPKDRIEVSANSDTQFVYINDPRQAISLDAIWGCVPHYLTGAFKTTGVTLATGGLAAGMSELELADGQGERFETLQYVRFADASKEMAQILEINEDTLIFGREELGTTAPDTHASSVALQIYQPPRDVMAAVRAMTIYQYMNKDSVGRRTTVIANGTVMVEDLDPIVQKTIDRYREQVMYFGAVNGASN